jgi:hypothetical protein
MLRNLKVARENTPEDTAVEVKAADARKHILVGVADVERVIETAELCENAASEPVMVMEEDAKKSREAAQTAVEDIPALDFQSTVENAEEPNCAAQVAN